MVRGALAQNWLRVTRDEVSTGIAELRAADQAKATMADGLSARISTIGVAGIVSV